MGVAQNIRRGFGVGLPVPETNFEKLGPTYGKESKNGINYKCLSIISSCLAVAL